MTTRVLTPAPHSTRIAGHTSEPCAASEGCVDVTVLFHYPSLVVVLT